MLGILGSWAMDTGQQIFWDNVKSLSVQNPDNLMAPPVIRLGSRDHLSIKFDIISNDYEYLRYRVIHCNADWQPSRLMESEYLDGFNEMEVDDYAFSSNTYIQFVNYQIEIPNPQLPITASGNYLLQVYPESDYDDILLQVRFSVSEENAFIQGGLTSKTDKGVNGEFQQLFLKANLSSFPGINPYQDLVISIIQNNRPETTKFISHPIRVEGNNAIFEHSPDLIFEAGNEYRRFETVRTDYPGMHVDSVQFIAGIWHAWLQPDSSRKDKEYFFDSTQHGRFKIDEYNSTEPDLSADYVVVHFTLDTGETPDGLVYVDGDFTNHRFNESNLMKYDFRDGLYHASIPLKQGSYNYQYVVVPRNKGAISSRLIEGNKYETQNEYLIKLFLRLPGARADQLIGTALIQ